MGKLTVYRRWTTKEDLIAQAVEQLVSADMVPTTGEVRALAPQDIIEAGLKTAAETTASPAFRALVARMMGAAVSHPQLMAVYWRHHVLPRRELATAMLRRAQQDGTVAEDADLDVLIDMMAGAVTWRVLQPDPPDADGMLDYLKSVYRQIGLYPR
ncbi:TetR/AcrR family transcriptional regulator [Nonomuraea salmonea]